MLDILAHEFMRNALMAGVLAGVACGVIGALVVVNRLVFLAGGAAHAAYGGVGLAFFLGWPVLPTVLGFTAAASLAMGCATLRRRERADALIGVMWAAGMATGVVLLDLAPGYNTDLMSYLFGSILAVTGSDLLLMLLLDAVILGAVFLFYKLFLAMTFDEEFARTRGVAVTALHFLLLAMIAVSVVMLIRVVGLILVIALLSIPPHLAERNASSMSGMMIGASLWSMAFCIAGLCLSYLLDLTSGASIILVAVAVYGLALLWDAARGKRRVGSI